MAGWLIVLTLWHQFIFFIGQPGQTTVFAQSRRTLLKTVRLHQARQARIMRLMAFGAGKGMFPVCSPPLDRTVDLTGLGHASGLDAGMAPQTNATEGSIRFHDPRASLKGVPVNVVLHARHGHRFTRRAAPCSDCGIGSASV